MAGTHWCRNRAEDLLKATAERLDFIPLDAELLKAGNKKEWEVKTTCGELCVEVYFFGNNKGIQMTPESLYVCWWTGRDSNARPSASESLY